MLFVFRVPRSGCLACLARALSRVLSYFGGFVSIVCKANKNVILTWD
jgi:hypothetical protein